MAPVKKPSYKEGQAIMLRQVKECPWGYPAEIIKVDTDDSGITSYTVHYNGWNSRYDEVITEELAADRFYEWSEKAERESKLMQREAAIMNRKMKADDGSRESDAGSSHDSTPSISISGKRANRGQKQRFSPTEDSDFEKTPAKKRSKKEADSVYEVEKVIGKRMHKGKLQYRLLWKDSDGEKTWENVEDCACKDLIQLYLDEKKPSTRKSGRGKEEDTTSEEESDDEKTPSKKRNKKEGDSVYEVEKVIGKRMHKGKLQYRLLWKDSDGEKTWENVEDCACEGLIQRYLEENKPSTPKSVRRKTDEEESSTRRSSSKKATDVNQSASLASPSHTPRRRGRPPKVTADVTQSASLASPSHTPRPRGRPPKATGGGEGSSPGKKAAKNKPAAAVTSPRASRNDEVPKFDIASHAQFLKDHGFEEKTLEELEHKALDEIFGHKVEGVVAMQKNGTEAIIRILPAGRASPLAMTPLINVSLPLLIKRCPKATAAYIIAVNGAVCGTMDGEEDE